ncbi:MAG TPA: acyl-CoA dehydrogenase family protein [Burkholderiaceae bacterium]|jgi:acyl-CoA dehydrogenase
MTITLRPELEEMRASLRKFCTEQLEPLARRIDATDELPPEVVPLLADAGYLGMRLPAKNGGMDVDLSTYCLVLEELSRVHRVFNLIVSASSGIAPSAIAHLGTPEQQDRYLNGVTRGLRRGAFALTEPEAGSDSASMRTRAERRNGQWVLNGRKHYISGGHVADFIVVLAVTDPVKRSRGGITAFVVEKGTPGFEVSRVESTMGSAVIKVAELTFNDCTLDDSAVLGEVGGGFKVAMSHLGEGRLCISAACIGTSDRLIEMSVEHAKNRHTFGKPLAARQAIQWMIADSAVELACARALTYGTLQDLEAGKDVGVRPNMAKLHCSEMVGRIADRAVQIHGGMGIVKGFPVERFYRDIRHYRVGDGTSEVQRMVIARSLVGKGE